jgi:hypothetical protein
MKQIQTAQILGFAGTLPFILGAVFLWFGPLEYKLPVFNLFLSYTALILAFLGGVHWGRALHNENVKYYVISILPSLWAWGCLFLAPHYALVGLLVGHVGFFLWERSHITQAWYLNLRATLTSIVTICLVAVLVIVLRQL